jgi:hypothetical protein
VGSCAVIWSHILVNARSERRSRPRSSRRWFAHAGCLLGAAPTQMLAGDSLPDFCEGLVGQPDQVEAIDDDDRARQRAGDRGPVDSARVNGPELDLVLPGLAAVIEPAGHGGAGAPGGLLEQPPGPGQLGEVGLEPLGSPPRPPVPCLSPGGAGRGGSRRCLARLADWARSAPRRRSEMPVRYRPAHAILGRCR